jgi:hypothetical protein
MISFVRGSCAAYTLEKYGNSTLSFISHCLWDSQELSWDAESRAMMAVGGLLGGLTPPSDSVRNKDQIVWPEQSWTVRLDERRLGRERKKCETETRWFMK